uniref:Uncharacterized protein n=1 Tax=Astyanax mexicanus TaxID=7994 RepID=A0A8B9R3R5_ASTMX
MINNLYENLFLRILTWIKHLVVLFFFFQQTVQIMIGLFMFLFGIVISTNAQPSITVYSGISFWGSLLFIVTGSLAVSANNKLHRCVVNGALKMNVFSAVTAAIAIIFISVDLVRATEIGSDRDGDEHNAQIVPAVYYYGCRGRYRCSSRSNGIAGVLLVFCVLQFIISIFISAYSCRAVPTVEQPTGTTRLYNFTPTCCVFLKRDFRLTVNRQGKVLLHLTHSLEANGHIQHH